jgi:hypothetical protein
VKLPATVNSWRVGKSYKFPVLFAAGLNFGDFGVYQDLPPLVRGKVN